MWKSQRIHGTGIFTYMKTIKINHENVGKYTIHGSSGNVWRESLRISFWFVIFGWFHHLHVIQCFHIPCCLFTSPCWLLQVDLYEMTFGDFESIEIYQCLEISDYKHPIQNCQDNLWKNCWCFSVPALRDQVWLHCRRNFEQNMDQMAPDDMLLAPVCQGAQYGR